MARGLRITGKICAHLLIQVLIQAKEAEALALQVEGDLSRRGLTRTIRRSAAR